MQEKFSAKHLKRNFVKFRGREQNVYKMSSNVTLIVCKWYRYRAALLDHEPRPAGAELAGRGVRPNLGVIVSSDPRGWGCLFPLTTYFPIYVLMFA